MAARCVYTTLSSSLSLFLPLFLSLPLPLSLAHQNAFLLFCITLVIIGPSNKKMMMMMMTDGGGHTLSSYILVRAPQRVSSPSFHIYISIYYAAATAVAAFLGQIMNFS